MSAQKSSLQEIAAGTFAEVEKAISRIAPMSRQGATWESLLCEWLVADPLTGIKEVWSWQEWPGRRRAGLGPQDLGVDLVAVDFDGQLIGIQAKFRNDPDSPITTPEVQKFIGAYQGLFDRRVIATNASTVSANISRGTANEVSYFLRHHFIQSNIDWNALCSRSLQRSLPRFDLEPYQAEAVEAVCDALHKASRTQLIMACGTGKSFTMLKIAEALNAEKILVLAPTLLLVGQLRAEWKQQATVEFVDLAVCSDQSLTSGRRDEADIDSTEFGGQVTTDVAVISRFLKRSGRRVIFGTYASSPKIAAAQQEVGDVAFDLTVCDEAHRLANSELKDSAQSSGYKIVLEENGIASKKRLFATATPKIFSGVARKTADGAEIAVDSMDNPERFGDVAFNFSFRAAIEVKPRPRLVPYQVLVTVVTDQEVHDAISQRRWAESSIDFETIASGFAVERAFQEYPIRRMISYHSSIDRARQFGAMLSGRKVDSETLETAMVSGRDAVSERQDVLNTLRLGLKPTLVTNARCLTEGVDVPALDAVAFIDPRSSRVDIVQAVGRAMRISPGKDKGYVIVPLYLRPEQVDGRDAIDGASFRPVLDVLRALKAHDPLIAEFFTTISLGAGARKDLRHDIEKVVLLDGSPSVNAGLLEKVARSISLEAISVTAGGFWRNFAELKEFVEINNGMPTHWKAPRGPGVSIGSWVASQRVRYRSGLLSNDRIAALESLKGWTWTTADNSYSANLKALKEYVDKGGAVPVPRDTIFGGRHIGRFYSLCTRKMILGIFGSSELSQFSGIHPKLVPKPLHSAKTYLSALERYLEGYPLATINQSTVVDGIELGQWVHAIWATQVGPDAKKIINPEIISALEELDGWARNKRIAQTEMGMHYLKRFQQREGHTDVPLGHVEDGYHLDRWVKNQRFQYQIGYMDEKLRKRLESIPTWEWAPELSEVLQHSVLIGRYLQSLTLEGSQFPKERECRAFIRKLWRMQHQLNVSDRKRIEEIWGWAWSAADEKWFTGLIREIRDVAASAKGLRLDVADIGKSVSRKVTPRGVSSNLPRNITNTSYIDESNQALFLKLARWSERARSSSGVPQGQLIAVGELIPLHNLGVRLRG